MFSPAYSFLSNGKCSAAEIPGYLEFFAGDEEVRSIQAKDLTPAPRAHMLPVARAALAWPMWKEICAGPSTADCEKSFYRTGVPTANMLKQGVSKPRTTAPLIQIRPVAVSSLDLQLKSGQHSCYIACWRQPHCGCASDRPRLRPLANCSRMRCNAARTSCVASLNFNAAPIPMSMRTTSLCIVTLVCSCENVSFNSDPGSRIPLRLHVATTQAQIGDDAEHRPVLPLAGDFRRQPPLTRG